MTECPADPLGPTDVPFRVAFVPGVTPDKWVRGWRDQVRRVPLDLVPTPECDQIAVLEDRADMSLVRLPVDQTGLSVIPLYSELPVVVVPIEHAIAAFDEVTVSDLADEHLLQDPAEVPEWGEIATEIRDGSRVEVPSLTAAESVETCAAGGGIVVLPMSVARLHHRKDVTYRPVIGVAETRIGLAWPTDATSARTDMFVGIVRGRTQQSSRTAAEQGQGREEKPKPSQPPRRSDNRSDNRSGGRRRRRGGRR